MSHSTLRFPPRRRRTDTRSQWLGFGRLILIALAFYLAAILLGVSL